MDAIAHRVEQAVITLRPVTASDQIFLLAVYASTREAELRLVPWTIEQKHEFVAQQFVAQDTAYHRDYPDASFDIIEVDGRDAGRLLVERRTGVIDVLDIALLPQFQAQGVGTTVMRGLCAEATANGGRISLYVEKFNPARAWYEWLGFREVSDAEVYLLLEWLPPGPIS
jgi:ribosomal protein S18 acetylase RimI-like enzyme